MGNVDLDEVDLDLAELKDDPPLGVDAGLVQIGASGRKALEEAPVESENHVRRPGDPDAGVE